MLLKFSSIATLVSLVASVAEAAPLKANAPGLNATEELIEYAASGETGWEHPIFPYFQSSCNATNQRILTSGLKDLLEVTAVAKGRLLSNGTDDTFERWFGNGSIFTVLGAINNAIESDKTEVSYRCDDPLDYCAIHTNYPGYHVTNTTGETNICDLFYQTKKPLSTICFEGDIVDLGPKHYAGIDLFHRFFHLDVMNGDGYIQEYSETLAEALYLAQYNSTYAVRNTDNYLYYLADVYATTVNPGGCLGELPEAESS